MSETQSEYQNLSNEDALQKFNVKIETGLSQTDAQERLSKNGPNQIQEKKKSKWTMLFAFFWGPIPWMIEIAIVLSALLKRWPDFFIILALLLINALLGFIQESKAGNAIAALKEKLALKSRVLRDSKWQEVEAKDLVPGDIISVKLGNIIPADIKLISGEYLSVDQASLTGESLPVDKKLGDVAFSGTIAKKGEMTGLVTGTGMNTFIGKTAKLVDSAKTVSHFQEAILKIGRFLIYTTLVICAIIFGVLLYRIHQGHSAQDTFGQIIIFVLVIIIAGIPVALPAVLSVTLAVGAHKLAQMKAIVSKLIAIEELANMNELCSDKTGTLTKNELSLGDIQTHGAQDAQEVLFIASLASVQEGDDVIDKTIISGLQNKEALKEYTVEKFLPFDPVKKSSESIIKGKDGQSFHACKGAPQILLDMAQPDEGLRNNVQKCIEDLAQKGFRTIGVARSNADGSQWQFLGLIPLFDPPRDDCKETINKIKSLEVNVHMITGDNVAIARQLASQLCLGTNIISIEEVLKQKGKIEEAHEELKKGDGFAQVFPEHKFEIIKAFQEDKNVVGMTGDGVNDAPALKQADIGIAVSGATDAARSAADLVLTEPGLNTIYNAIEESRRVFGRMKSYAMYRISETCRLLFFLLLSVIVFNDRPLTAIMIILIALLNDIPIMSIAYDNMEVKTEPVIWRMKEVFTVSIGLALVGVLSTFGLYWIGEKIWQFDFYHSRTLAFLAILCGGNLTIYLMRNEGMLWQSPKPNIKFLVATWFSLIVGTLVSVYGLGTQDFLGIGWKYVVYSWIYILIWFGICFLTKLLIYAIFGFNKNKSEPQVATK
ncbi:MAG: Calcium-transporting ATPase 1 [Chlamydiae bacterium]|nr:Calcium-transporting ATPase 1 [Chlamydiota bacterium]